MAELYMLYSTFWNVIWGSFIVFFVFIPLLLLWVFALVDLFMNKGLHVWSRVLWLLFIIFIPILGTLIYLLVRPQEYAAPAA